MSEVKDYPPYLDYPKPRKPATEADRIRAMSDEELAKWINDGGTVCATCAYNENCNEPFDREKCLNGILKRLQQPAEEVPGNGSH